MKGYFSIMTSSYSFIIGLGMMDGGMKKYLSSNIITCHIYDNDRNNSSPDIIFNRKRKRNYFAHNKHNQHIFDFMK